MIHSWMPGLTLCMSVLNNTSMGPPPGDPGTISNFPYTTYLDAAMMLLEVAKRGAPKKNRDIIDRADYYDDEGDDIEPGDAGSFRPGQCPANPIDCEELLTQCGAWKSGVYRIYPRSRVNTWGEAGFDVFCDMETDGGGWTVIQRRDDFGTNSDFFFKGWQSYKFGFGDLNYDYWLGNDKIFALSNQRNSVLRFDLLDFEGDDGYATYNNFYIEDENQGYRIHIGDYRGIIGDSFKGHNRMRFSTRDRDNDNNPNQNCALLYKGGWWYNNCHTVNLNGLYLKGTHNTYANGVNWYGWKGFRYSLRKTEMKLRSSAFISRRSDADVNAFNSTGLKGR